MLQLRGLTPEQLEGPAVTGEQCRYQLQLSLLPQPLQTGIHDPAFGEALREAARQGVEIVAYTCRVTPETVTLDAPVPVQL